MIVILKPGTQQEEIRKLTQMIESKGVSINPVYGENLIILGLVGDTSKIDPTQIEANRNVERVMHVAEPFKKANRMFHPDDTVVHVGGEEIGGERIALIAGPCSVESEEQIVGVAESVKALARISCAAARSSRARRLTRSRASNTRGLNFCARRGQRRACPL